MRALLLIAMLAGSTPAFADAKADHLAKADAAFKAGNYEAALESLEAAYKIDPDPDVVFALGQVHMKLGDCKQAIAYYQSYLATKPDPKLVNVVNKAIERCKAMKTEPDPEPTPEPKPEPKPETPSLDVRSPPLPPPPTRAHVPWYRDALGDTLLLTGAAAGAASGIVYFSARAHRKDADTAPTYNDYVDEIDASKRNRKIALAGGAVSGALVVFGVVRYATRSSTRERAAVSVAPTNHGAVTMWSVRF